MEKYQVGGYVRDKLLGTESADVDYVVVNESPDAMLARGFKLVGMHFPVFLHPETGEEYALARAEVSTGKGHADFDCSWEGVTLEQDLHRRDFTINAMALTPDNELIDPYNGHQDLNLGIIRHVSNHFTEDPLRILRGARFAARYSFGIHYDTSKLMKSMVEQDMLETLPPERLWGEIEKALLTDKPRAFFEALDACGALKRIFPEITAMKGIPQSKQWHAEGDVFVHTLMVLDEAVILSRDLPKERKLRIRMAALLHDLGKPHTPVELLWDVDGTPIGKHHGHEDPERFVPSLNALAKRINMPSHIRKFVWKVTVAHQLVHRIGDVGVRGLVSLYQRLDCSREMRNDPFFIEDIGWTCKADSLGRRITRPNGSIAKVSEYPQMRSFRIAMFRISMVPVGEIITTARDEGYSMDTALQRVVTAQRRSVKNIDFSEGREMALSDCVQCWETPCRCGYDYRNWKEKDLKDLIGVLTRVLNSKDESGEAQKKLEVEKSYLQLNSRLQATAELIRKEFELVDDIPELSAEQVRNICARLVSLNPEGMPPIQLVTCKRDEVLNFELTCWPVAGPIMSLRIGIQKEESEDGLS